MIYRQLLSDDSTDEVTMISGGCEIFIGLYVIRYISNVNIETVVSTAISAVLTLMLTHMLGYVGKSSGETC